MGGARKTRGENKENAATGSFEYGSGDGADDSKLLAMLLFFLSSRSVRM